MNRSSERYWSDKGRISRKTYVIRTVVLSLIIALLIQVNNGVFGSNNYYLVLIARVVAGQISMFAFFMQLIKRTQDIGKNGWWFVLFFLPLVNVLLLLYTFLVDGTSGPNRYGDDPKGRESIIPNED